MQKKRHYLVRRSGINEATYEVGYYDESSGFVIVVLLSSQIAAECRAMSLQISQGWADSPRKEKEGE